jgi:hypothetical protein
MLHEIVFLAHATLRDFCALSERTVVKNQVICSNSGKSLDGVVNNRR